MSYELSASGSHVFSLLTAQGSRLTAQGSLLIFLVVKHSTLGTKKQTCPSDILGQAWKKVFVQVTQLVTSDNAAGLIDTTTGSDTGRFVGYGSLRQRSGFFTGSGSRSGCGSGSTATTSTTSSFFAATSGFFAATSGLTARLLAALLLAAEETIEQVLQRRAALLLATSGFAASSSFFAATGGSFFAATSGSFFATTSGFFATRRLATLLLAFETIKQVSQRAAFFLAAASLLAATSSFFAATSGFFFAASRFRCTAISRFATCSLAALLLAVEQSLQSAEKIALLFAAALGATGFATCGLFAACRFRCAAICRGFTTGSLAAGITPAATAALHAHHSFQQFETEPLATQGDAH
jgi:hypothetical protein